ncbi:related to multidrug resistant protein [Ramularia collo-cygni]|uniref:Related to multidrug resistant protein n=1 Tax=Ramularia collo-cygni TaxID=112498 RepID=A0A2D3V8P7_9PEZI|nr:related to multidrug resistant protein [Ramularia collo-cygni]CZT16753.1 related to multidrug resistant protein [Ramularia collo-cygni]
MSFHPYARPNRSSWSLGLDALVERTSRALKDIQSPEAAILGSRVRPSRQCSAQPELGDDTEAILVDKLDKYTARYQCPQLQKEQADWENFYDNPQNWPARKKWRVVAIATWLSFITSLASSIITPSLPDIASDLRIESNAVTILIVSLFLLGTGVGGILSVPLSEMHGRLPIYQFSNVCFTALTVSCGFAPNFPVLIALRFLAGSLGTACLVIGGCTCADMFLPQQRATAISLWAGGIFLGSCIGPVFGGLIVEAKNWRWIFYILAMAAGASMIVCALFMPETSVLVIRRRRGVPVFQREKETQSPQHPAKHSLRDLTLPLKLLAFSPIVLLMTFHAAIAHAMLYLLFTSIPFTFSPRYQFSPRDTGLLYLAPALGMMLGAFAAGQLGDRTVKRIKALGGTYTPEKRLDPMIIITGSLSMIAGLLLYGWSLHYHIHWISALAGLFMFGFGLVLTVASAQTYVVESHPTYEANVSAAFSLLNAVLSGALPVWGVEIFYSLGMGWGSVLLAGLVAISSFAFVVCRVKGPYLRQRFKIESRSGGYGHV